MSDTLAKRNLNFSAQPDSLCHPLRAQISLFGASRVAITRQVVRRVPWRLFPHNLFNGKTVTAIGSEAVLPQHHIGGTIGR